MLMLSLGRYLSRLTRGAMPAFSLNFLTTQTIPSNLFYARSSNALMLDTAGFFVQVATDVPRFLTNQTTQGAAGLLLEGQATVKNLYTRPSTGTLAQHFSSVPAQLSIVTDATNPGKNLSNGNSVWQLQNNTGAAINVLLAGTTGSTLTHNIQVYTRTIAGTGGSVSLSGTGSVAFSNTGWARVVSEGLTPATAGDQLQITVNANSTVLFTCANLQFAQEGTATRYSTHNTTLIDSAGTQVTRAGDRLHPNSVAWFNAAQGTIFVQYEDPRQGVTNTQSRRLFQFDRTTSVADRIAISFSNTTNKRLNAVVSDNSVSSVSENHTFTGTFGPVMKVALAYSAADCVMAWQNIVQFTDTTTTPLPDEINNLSLGYDRTTLAAQMNACLQRFDYYPRKLSTLDVQRLTL